MNTLLPSSPRFLKGLQVAPVLLSDELKAELAVEPSPGGVQYIIATQVRPVHTAGTPLPAGGPAQASPTVWAGGRDPYQPWHGSSHMAFLGSESLDTGLLISPQ